MNKASKLLQEAITEALGCLFGPIQIPPEPLWDTKKPIPLGPLRPPEPCENSSRTQPKMVNPNFGPCSNPFCDWFGHRCLYNMCGICCTTKHAILCKESHPMHPERCGYRDLSKARKTIMAATVAKPEVPVAPVLGTMKEITEDFNE